MLKFFVYRPKAAIVLSLVLVLVGSISLISLPVTQFPQITPPSVSISGSYIGADALTVEQTVTTPIEVQVNGTPGMDYITSNSTNNGVVGIDVTFELGTDIDIAALDVQNRLGIAEPQLPEAVRRLGLTVRKRNPGLFMLVALRSPDGTHDSQFLDNYANIYVRDRLLRVEGIGDAFAVTKDFSMRLWLYPDQMAQLGLTPDDVIQAVQTQNRQVAAGSVGAPPQPDNQAFEYTVFLDGRLEDVSEFENIIIRNDTESGALIRVKDVGRVELGTFTYGNQSLVNHEEGSILILYQAPGSNALATAQGVYDALEELSEDFPPDVTYQVPYEAASVVEVSIREVVNTLLIALAIVAFIVFLFLQRWRASIIPLLAIPVSIIGAMIFFSPLGFNINTLTLFGFVLAIGIVVDDSIVVVEAIQSKLEGGDISVVEATESALDDVATPVVTTSLILVAIFVPVAFITGLTGQLYQQFAITISVAVLLSSLVALTLAPALAVLLFNRERKQAKWLEKVFKPFNRGLEKLRHGYANGLDWVLTHYYIALALLAGLIVATYVLFQVEPTGFVPTEDEGRIFVTFELPEAAANSRTLGVMEEIMSTLDTVPEIESYTAVASLNAITFTERSNTGTIFVQLTPWGERTEDGQGIFAMVSKLERYFADIVDARVVVIPPPPIPGLGSTSGFSFILQDRSGNASIQEFETTMNDFIGRINQREEITGAFSFFTAQAPSYQLTVDRVRAKQLGVPLTSIYSTLSTYLGSAYINDFTLYGRTFRVVAQADTAYRAEIEDLADYYVENDEGTMVPMANLISYELGSTAPLISHYNLFRSASITGNAAEGFSSGQVLDVLREEAESLPTGYGYEFSGLSKEQAESGSTTVYIFIFSIALAFLILVALYESWTVPFSVLMAAPTGIFGALLTLWFLPDIDNNIYAQIGLITIVGLAAKNAILIVEFAKQNVESGQDIREATVNASRARLRPILMTSATFVFGMIPLAAASGAGANSRQTIGFVVIGGLVAVTGLAIFFVPVLYDRITRLAYSDEELANYREEEEE
ncbi:HAE1 family hydrophobic/amphiphilic exporter-1 [Neolewinella xylanilytica]|uniref:HAE1 family hydrophobic/amphiphilic exporter-1 n=1 Tax=Neolewinella xylanilytica TaxID=1514080 RepID=A0A2S6I4Y4_9BACT|nr:efflux RND transporter permease subunit [Neolewinella xylanilytica]PPK86237.1 HAE1 family hydrophobic/amphiphilic exporter-1 [Neolewinella xylanilytica]